MGRIPDVQIAQAAAGAGFSGDSLVTSIAIAIAESGGDAGNTTGDGGTSYGLWQIHWTVHPQFDRMQLLDPNYNAAAAWQLSNGGTYWHPWTTYFQGTYRKYIPRAQAAAAAVSTVGTAQQSFSSSGGTDDAYSSSDLAISPSLFAPASAGNIGVGGVVAIVAGVLLLSLILDA